MTRTFRSESEPCKIRSCSPWHRPFPPEPPQVGRAFPCSAPSSVIPRIPTPPRRSYPASRSSLFLGRTALRQSTRRSPGSRAYGCWLSSLGRAGLFDYVGFLPASRLSAGRISPSLSDHKVGIPNWFFGDLSPSPPFPLFTLRLAPHDATRRSCAFPSSCSRSSAAPPSSASATTVRSYLTCANRAPSSRTPTSVLFCFHEEYHKRDIEDAGYAGPDSGPIDLGDPF